LVCDVGTFKKLVSPLNFHGIGMEVFQRTEDGPSWCFDFTGLKGSLLSWFVLEHDSMADTMVFFNVGLRCWNIQKASWSVEISWKWNESSANEKLAGAGGLTSPV
jgi:hypothetical protein